MNRKVYWALIGLVVVALAIQLVPVNRNNPGVETEVGAPAEVHAILKRACYDCHSFETAWPWYSHVAPVSWLVSHDVREGRGKLNFSTWNRLTPNDRIKARGEIREEVEAGEMPLWFYVIAHPESELSREDVSAIVAWTQVDPVDNTVTVQERE